MPAMVAGLPPSRLLPGGLVQIDDDLPDLLLGQPVFPGRHHRVPRRRLLREAGTALGDAPEEVGLLEHRDRAGILEVGGRGIEAGREVALAVEVVAVAVHAVADVRLAALRRLLLEPGGALRSEEHTSELQSLTNLVCRLLLEKKKKQKRRY